MRQPPPDAPVRRSALPSDGGELHASLLRKRLTSLVTEACQGGISTITEPDVFLQRINIAESAADFSNVLLDVHSSIPPGWVFFWKSSIFKFLHVVQVFAFVILMCRRLERIKTFIAHTWIYFKKYERPTRSVVKSLVWRFLFLIVPYRLC